MLKIWGRDNSSNVQKVLWCCAELGVDYERVDAGGAFGVVNTPQYLAMNPNAKVPTIEDDGFVLWESNAIVRYLAAKHGAGTLFPDDLQVRADADRWMDWQMSTYWPVLIPVFWGLVRTPPEKRDVAAIDAGAAEAGELSRHIDAHLEGRDFLAGSSFTMGDIPLGVIVYRWLQMDVSRASLPHLEAWYARLCERPGFQTHIMHPLT